MKDALDRMFGSSAPGSAPPEAISPGLFVEEQAPAGVAWGTPERVAELAEQRTPNTRFYQLSDGRVQAEVYAGPVHYRDAQGNLQSIDTRVGDVGRTGFVAGNTTNSFTSLFGATSDRLVRSERNGRFIELGLAGPATPLQPEVAGSTVTYAGAAGGADLVYEVTSTALKESIVLREPPAAAARYTFSLRTGELVAEKQSDGSIAFTRPGAERPDFVMPAPYMFDSKDDASSPYGKAFSDRVTQVVRQAGGETVIAVSADAGWLADPARVYPVTIDPTIRIVPVPEDGQDVQIYSGFVTRNYNDSYQLKVGTDGTDVLRSLVQFPLTGVPANVQVDDARLELYYDQTHTAFEYEVAMEARQVTAPWDETTATWETMNAAMAEQPAGNVVLVDDGDPGTSIVGTWPYSTNAQLRPKAINADYRFDNDATGGSTHTWVPTITESGDYQVEVHFVSSSDRATNAPYTVHYAGGSQTYEVDQTGNDLGEWRTLGVHPFEAGTTGRIVLGDVPGKAVIADAVRLTRWGTATKKQGVSSVWSSFPVRNVVQDWVNGTAPNYGFMVKAVDEEPTGRGGPIFEASEYAYNNDRRDFNLPRLVVTFGRQGAAVNPPTLVTATGAQLDWPAYVDPSAASGDDIVEYQVHRSVFQTYTPSAATLVAPVSPATLSYQDTTATPTPADETDPLQRQFYYYMVAVKTADGEVIAGPTQPVMLPKAGQITRIYRTGVTDVTLSADRPSENVDSYAGDPYVSPGNNSTLYGDTRGLVKFPSLDGIPSDARVVGADLRLWNVALIPGTDTDEWVDVYKLTRGFDETTATWNSAAAGVAWTTPGGDYDPSWSAGFNGFTNDPEWETWDVSEAVSDWLAAPASNHGLLLRQRDEQKRTARAMLLSAEAAEPLLRPTLEVTYLERTAESTYYAPTTPALAAPDGTYTVPVTVSNPTQTTWTTANWELSYRWSRADGSPATTPSNQVATPLPQDIDPGEAVDIAAGLNTPDSVTDGNKRTDYVLSWELRNKTTGQWLSQSTPIAALAQNVAVDEATSDQLGLEKFYAYSGMSTGAGGTAMNNLYAGNTVWSYDAFANPSRGGSTFVRLAYNSLDTSDTGAGYGWSLQASTLTRLGKPLDFHPNPNPTTVTLSDGDGTSHRFTWDPGVGEWVSPRGVHLYLQRLVECGNHTEESRAWVMTRPDRTRFFFDCDGYLSAVADNNGNELLFTYEQRKSANKPIKFLRYITDPAGRQTLRVDYYAKGDAYDYIDDTTWTRQSGSNLTNPHIIDHVKQVTDISGRTLTFTYTDKGLLGELIDGAGSTNGDPKVFAFRYDMTQGNKNVKLIQVTDPRGHAANLEYYSPPQDDPKFHWRTRTYTNRLGHQTQFAYTDPDGPQGNDIHTTITDAENHTTAYQMDGFGRPRQATNAKQQTTTLDWDDDHNVNRLVEANGAEWTWTYDQKTGYPTEIRDAQAVHDGTPGTVLDYQRQLNGYVADLTEQTSPEGRTTTYTYTLEGDLASVTDPLGNTTADPDDYTTTYSYDDFGQLSTATDANGNTTTYSDFDATGSPRVITDAKDKSTTVEYDVRGLATHVTDALQHTTTQTYDTFGRPLVATEPKDQDAGVFIVTPAPQYDGNDNVVTATAPNGAVTTASYDEADQVTFVLAPVDEIGDPQRKTSYTYDNVGNLLTTTEPQGNLTTDPADFTTTNTYNEIYELASVIDAEGHTLTYEYDNVGNMRTVIDPRKNATSDPADYTTKYDYDLAHRPTTTTDAIGKVTSVTYDLDGLVTSQTDQTGNTTSATLDARGLPIEVNVPHSNDGGTITYRTVRYEYDEVGNQTRTVTPRGVATDDDPNDFATVAIYDELNRVQETHTAFDEDDARYTTADKTIYTYDDVGRVTVVSAPPSSGESVRNDTMYTYFDNGWTATSTDSHGVVTGYDYNQVGAQTSRTVTPAGGSPTRAMTWSYFLDGKLATHLDVGGKPGSSDSDRNEYAYGYDPNGNLTTINDNSPAARVDTYTVDYTELNQVEQVLEFAAGVLMNTTTFTYNENGAPETTSHDRQHAEYTYDPRDLIATVINGTSASDPDEKTTTFTYTDRGEPRHVIKGNGNTVDYTYFLDGLLRTEAEKKPDGTVVSQHTLDYDLNGNRSTDQASIMDADNHAAYLNTTSTYTYDPRDRIATVTRAGDGAGTETYVHDANDNVIEQTVNDTTTTFNYDRNRLVESTATSPEPPAATSTYGYDVFGRLITVSVNGTVVERNIYDGFDHVGEHQKFNGTTMQSTTYTYDALGRTTTRATEAGATTTFNYLGLSSEVLDEEVAGQLTKSYQYSPSGQRLSQVTHNDDGTKEHAYYSYNPHTDVEALTDDTGNSKATYGYTAYGSDVEALFTGVDKPDEANPDKPQYNPYRFNGKRFDQASGTYDMGFRDYSPGINRFLTSDTYNSAMADLGLGLFGGGRYAFGAGNPIGNIELDGHDWVPGWLKQVGGFFKGVGEQAWDEVRGLGEALYGCYTDGPHDILVGCGDDVWRLGGFIKDHPGDFFSALWHGVWDPIADDWNQGNYGEAIGRGAFTIASLIFGGKGITKIRNLFGARPAAAAPAAAAGPVLAQGFRSFRAAKRALPPPGRGNVYDHVVEQAQIKPTRSGFDPRLIHNPYNLNPVTRAVNQAKADYYASIRPFTGGQTVRNWLNGQSFAAQYQFGIDITTKIQNGVPLP